MRRVALVEDNPDTRLLVQAVLGRQYCVTAYADGFAALDGMRREPPEIVLLDISLPGMDGEAVLRRLQDDAALRDVPVIAFTAHAMAGDRERFLTAGFVDYLVKPVEDINVLRDMVAWWLAA